MYGCVGYWSCLDLREEQKQQQNLQEQRLNVRITLLYGTMNNGSKTARPGCTAPQGLTKKWSYTSSKSMNSIGMIIKYILADPLCPRIFMSQDIEISQHVMIRQVQAIANPRTTEVPACSPHITQILRLQAVDPSERIDTKKVQDGLKSLSMCNKLDQLGE